MDGVDVAEPRPLAVVSSVRMRTDENLLQLRQVVLDVDVQRYADALALGGMEQVHKEFLECVKKALTRPLTEDEARGDNPMSVEEFGPVDL